MPTSAGRTETKVEARAVREWLAASDPSALGFIAGMLFMGVLVVLWDQIGK